MPAVITHSFVSTVPDSSDTSLVRPSNWNDEHVVALDVSLSELSALTTNSLLLGSSASSTAVTEITLGTNLSMSGTTLNGPSLNGYVPYTGATANVDLDAHSLTAQGLITTTEFIQTSTASNASIAIGGANPFAVTALNSVSIANYTTYGVLPFGGSNNDIIGHDVAINGRNFSGWVINGNNAAGSIFDDTTGGVLMGHSSDLFGDVGRLVGLGNLVIVGIEGVSVGDSSKAGPQSVSVGYGAGANLTETATGNLLLGYGAGSSLTTEDNKLYISNSLRDLITGDFSGSGALTLNAATVGITGAITSGTWNGTAINLSTYASGTLQEAQFPALIGDVTTSAGSLATTIAANAVTYAKMQAVSTTSKLLGSSSTTTPVQEITIGSGLSLSGTTLTSTGLGGTVTSVAVSGANGIGVSGSPITSSGTIALSLGTITGATWNGITIGIGYGGTNQTSFNTNYLVYFDGTRLKNDTNLGYDGSTINLGGAAASTANFAVTRNITGTTGSIYSAYIGSALGASSGTVSEAIAIYGAANCGINAGTITSAYGLKIDSGSAASTITNGYGIYVASLAYGTTRYGLYVEKPSGGTNNYAAMFAGPVGIGGGNINQNYACYINFPRTGASGNLFQLVVNGNMGATTSNTIGIVCAAYLQPNCNSNAGTITQNIGLYIDTCNAAATVTTGFGILVNPVGAGTTRYGIYLGAPTGGTTNYGAYLNGPSSFNVAPSTDTSLAVGGLGSASLHSLYVGGTISKTGTSLYMQRITGTIVPQSNSYNGYALFLDPTFTCGASGLNAAMGATIYATISGSGTTNIFRALNIDTSGANGVTVTTASGIHIGALALGDTRYGLYVSAQSGGTTNRCAFFGGPIQLNDNSTGSGTPILGTNCPATTLTAPYTWLKFISSDGSTVYVPAWK